MVLTHLVMFEFFPGASADTTPAVVATYAPNWLSPSMRMGALLLYLGIRWPF